MSFLSKKEKVEAGYTVHSCTSAYPIFAVHHWMLRGLAQHFTFNSLIKFVRMGPKLSCRCVHETGGSYEGMLGV